MMWDEETAKGVIAPLVGEPGPVLICLQAIQAHFGYVPHESIALIAREINVSRADVYGVLTYYSDLRTDPIDRPTIRICVAEACQSVGARELWNESEHQLADAHIEKVFCLGNCALGPAAMIGNDLIGRANVDRLRAAL
jgi:formate dehydrogenase subunit gamma